MNKFRLFAFFIVSVLSSVTAYAYDVEINGIYYNINQSAKTAEITSGDNPYPYSDLTIPESIVYNGVRYAVTCVGEYAFYSNENLSTLTIPATLDSIADYAFINCENLKSLYVCSAKPRCHLSSYGFTSSNLTFYVPTGTMYYFMAYADDYGWPPLIPFEIEYGDIQLTDAINLKEFDYDYEGVIVNMKCLDDEGSDITQSVNVDWYPRWMWCDLIQVVQDQLDEFEKLVKEHPELMEEESVRQELELAKKLLELFSMKKGSYLGKTPTNSELCYEISLPEETGRIYCEPPIQKVMVGESDVTFVCQLQKIQKVNLSGRVVASDIDEKTATVHVKQMLNKKYEETFTTQTNNKGEFSLEVYDDDTEIIISCDGYMDAVIHRGEFNGNGDLGQITLTPITGFVIPVNIECTPVAGDEDVTDDLLPGGLYDLELTLRNETTSEEITDFSVQYNGSLIIKSGVSAWDDISVTAKSKKHVLADAHTTFYLDEEGTNTIDLNFVELGGLSATFSESGNNNNAGYLYNSEGRLVARGVYNGETLRLKHIRQGTYTFVSIGQSSLLSNITYLSRLSQLNLIEGKDYLSSQVEIKDGETTVVSAGAIPKLNQSLFLFEGSLLADKESVVKGNYVTLSAKLKIDKKLNDKVNEAVLTIDIPEGCQMIEKSVMVGHTPKAYTVNGQTLTICLTKEEAQNEVRFCLSPTVNGAYTLTAYVTFDKEITSPRAIGVAHFDGENLMFRLHPTTADKTITVSGLTNPNSEVKIYDGTVKIGETTSKGDGTWAAQCELYNAYNLSIHDIIVKAKTPEGWALTSDVKSVMFDKSCIVPTRVTMTFYNVYHRDNITVNFDLINGTTSQKHYDFFNETDFTFIANFTRNDTTLIQDVNFNVKASDGTIRILPAVFDAKRQAWVATTRYDSYKLPENVTVDYIYTPFMSDDDREESLYDQATQLATCANHIYSFIEENTQVTKMEDEDDKTLFECRIKGMNTPLHLQFELLEYEKVEQMMKDFQFIYSWDEDGDIGYYTETNNGSIVVTAANITEEVAFRLSLSDPNAASRSEISEAAGEKGANSTLLNDIKKDFKKWDKLGSFFGHLSSILSIPDYMGTKSDYDNMYNQLLWYIDAFEQAQKNTTSKILAKCSDGSYRLTEEQRDELYKHEQLISRMAQSTIDCGYSGLSLYQTTLKLSLAVFATTSIASTSVRLAGGGAKLLSGLGGTKVVKGIAASKAAKGIKKWTEKLVKHNTKPTVVEKCIKGTLGAVVSKKILDGINKTIQLRDVL